MGTNDFTVKARDPTAKTVTVNIVEIINVGKSRNDTISIKRLPRRGI